MTILKEGTKFSWRKILTALSAITFFIANLGFLFGKFPELPGSYIIVHTTVILFYFGKNRISQITDIIQKEIKKGGISGTK